MDEDFSINAPYLPRWKWARINWSNWARWERRIQARRALERTLRDFQPRRG